jgi:hypothetical protein
MTATSYIAPRVEFERHSRWSYTRFCKTGVEERRSAKTFIASAFTRNCFGKSALKFAVTIARSHERLDRGEIAAAARRSSAFAYLSRANFLRAWRSVFEERAGKDLWMSAGEDDASAAKNSDDHRVTRTVQCVHYPSR